ncbi:Dual specificity protein kinase FUZ7 [Smittium mucronatum]|uniref:Dual specificity protein kinase FUZ7 n=1 Tax=Smittium mucronatum TaxID=133383 RepID=A0A1R0GTP7_9FUNG|nr:Dual specificity protein kinase FUZ7 [Smittium mucronatum]
MPQSSRTFRPLGSKLIQLCCRPAENGNIGSQTHSNRNAAHRIQTVIGSQARYSTFSEHSSIPLAAPAPTRAIPHFHSPAPKNPYLLSSADCHILAFGAAFFELLPNYFFLFNNKQPLSVLFQAGGVLSILFLATILFFILLALAPHSAFSQDFCSYLAMSLRKKRNFKGLALPQTSSENTPSPIASSLPLNIAPRVSSIPRASDVISPPVIPENSDLSLDFSTLSSPRNQIPQHATMGHQTFKQSARGHSSQNSFSQTRSKMSADFGSPSILDPSDINFSDLSSDNLNNINNLQLGLEYSLNIRQEDLKIISELGSGASGTVSKVLHVPTNTLMAMKVVRIELSVRQQILKELQILYECNSPFIVSFYGAFPQGNFIKICLEYMDLGSFDSIYRKHGRVPIDVLGMLTFSVLQGLTYLYNTHRIMHRDIKPSNILLNSSGEIKICDFGISKEMINSIANTFVGTASYMSPERMQGSNYTVKSDVWSLGTTLMELATARYPFRPEGENMSIFEMLDYIANEQLPTLDPNVFPIEFCDFVNTCLIKDPVNRPNPEALLSHRFVKNAHLKRRNVITWIASLDLKK